eukprot:8517791-Pyramimonas_sp.AAC.1
MPLGESVPGASEHWPQCGLQSSRRLAGCPPEEVPLDVVDSCVVQLLSRVGILGLWPLTRVGPLVPPCILAA